MTGKAEKKNIQPRNIGYLIIKHKNIISVVLTIISLTFGTIGFIKNSNGFWLSVIKSVKLFGLDFPTKPESLNWCIYTAIILVIITLSFTIVLIIIKNGMERFQRYTSFRNDHIAIFGLGEASVSFLSSYSKEHRKDRIVIIESDPNNKKLDEYRKLGYGVLLGDSFSESTLQRLNFKKMKCALIAMGSDGKNIELAKRIIKKYKAEEVKTAIKLIVHILNPELDTLFIQNLEDVESGKDKTIVLAKPESDTLESIGTIGPRKKTIRLKKLGNKEGEEAAEKEKSNFKIDIKTFSFFNEAAEGLFEEHAIEGNCNKCILSGETFKSILIGNGELIKSIIYQIAFLSHMPEENLHIVYIVDKDATNLLVEIKKRLHYSKAKFPKLKIKAIDIDKDSNDYFTNSIWNRKKLGNVIIAYDNEADNLNLAIELFNRTFKSKEIEEKDEIPKIIFAVYDQLLLSEIINKNEKAFKHFYTFGNSEKVLSYTSLIEEEKDMLAQLIHSGYEGAYNPFILHKGITPKMNIWQKAKKNLFCRDIEIDPILAKWYTTTEYVDRLSNIAQAKHIDMKLKTMGFKKRSVFEKTKDSCTVSFVGSTPNLEKELWLAGLFRKDMSANNSNSSENMSIDNPICYYSLRQLKAMGFKRRSVFEKTKDSCTVSFIGSISELENELKSVGLLRRDVPANNSNSTEDMSIEKPIRYYSLSQEAMRFEGKSVFEKNKDSCKVSFVGSRSDLEVELNSVGFIRRDVAANNSNGFENMSIENPIRYYSLSQEAKEYLAKKEVQQWIIKNALLSINRELLTNKFEKDRNPDSDPPMGIDDTQLEEYTRKMTLQSEIKKAHDESEEDCLKELIKCGVEDIKVAYFPSDFNTLFEKMIRVEHNRWMAYHYLNGWEYSGTKNKAKKEHNCLIPLEEFKDAMQKSVIYDMYSFLYLPNYLAEAGYEIVPIKDNEQDS